MNYIPLISNCAVKAAGVLAYMVQCGCITHCALEYIGQFIMVIVCFLFIMQVCENILYTWSQSNFALGISDLLTEENRI